MAHVRVLTPAQRQLYELRHHIVFGEEWNRALQRLAILPRSGHPATVRGIACHCLLLQRSQYHLYYRFDARRGEVVIFLIRSTKQQPL